VSTDSHAYQDLAISNGAECPFLRPSEISTDKSSDIEFINHALVELKQSGYRPDFIVHLRPTTPFRDPNVVEMAISQVKNRNLWSSIRSVHEMSESAYKSFEIDVNGKLVATFSGEANLEQSNLGRQLFPKTYQANGYVDILSVDFIEKSGQMHGDAVEPFVTEPAIEIDSLFDLKIAEAFNFQNPELMERLFEK
jgi:N-acylneuraminate cytidylyltransferase